MPILKIIDSTQSIEIATKKIVIGRHSGDDLTLNDAKCSRGNTEIEYKNKKYYIRDRGSRNGTYVNDTKIEDALELKYGDKILIGTTKLEFIRTPEKINLELIGYEIIEHIASGGMGKVYKARQVSLDRLVAVKVLAAKFTNDKRLTENFINEARSAGRLNHPNLVQVHDVNKDFQKDGSVVYYFSMEFVDGQTIKEIIRDQGKLPYIYTLDLLISTCIGLEYIHGNRLVHRDIKPDNLMLDADQTLKIADLGIALNIDESTGEDITEDGQRRVVGTPHYISPEQARGRKIDSRSDIYSLGATAFHMLTGETLFDGDNAKEIIKKHVNTEPRQTSELESKVPKQISDIVNKMLSKNVDDRPQSAKELREELEDLKLKLQKTHTHTRVSKHKNQKKKNPVLFSLIALSLGVIFALLYIFLTSGNQKSPTKDPSDTGGNTIKVNQTTLIQKKIDDAQKLSNNNKYQEAINIYNKLKRKYPNHDIVKNQIHIHLSKALESKKEYQNIQLKMNFNKVYKKLLSDSQTPNMNDLKSLETKLNSFIKRYKGTPEAKELRRQLNIIKGQINKEKESDSLERLKSDVNKLNSEEKQIAHLKKSKKSFYQAESRAWINKRIAFLNNKLTEQVKDAKKAADNINTHLSKKYCDYGFAMTLAKSSLNNYEYILAKSVIIKKIQEIENKANAYKNGVLKKANKNLIDDFDMEEAKLIAENSLSKLVGTKAHVNLTNYIKDLNIVIDLHLNVCSLLDGTEVIQFNYEKTEGFNQIILRSKKATKEKISIKKIKNANTNDEEETDLTKKWSSIKLAEVYRIYESVLDHKKFLKKYKKSMSTFKKIFNIKDSDIKGVE